MLIKVLQIELSEMAISGWSHSGLQLVPDGVLPTTTDFPRSSNLRHNPVSFYSNATRYLEAATSQLAWRVLAY